MPFPTINLKQAWLIPSAAAARQPERDRAGLVGRPPRRTGDRRRCPARRARCGRCGATRRCPALRERGLGRGPGGPHAAPHRDRRIARRRPARRGAPAGRRTRRSRPTPGPRRSTSGCPRSAERGARRRRPAEPPTSSSTRSSRSSWPRVGEHVWARGETTWAEAMRRRARAARLVAGDPRDRDRRRARGRCSAARRWLVRAESLPAPPRGAGAGRPGPGRAAGSATRPGRGRRPRRGRPAARRRHGRVGRGRDARAGRSGAGAWPSSAATSDGRGPRSPAAALPARDAARRARPAAEAAVSGGRSARARQVDDDDRVALEPDQPIVDELPEELVHALTGRPDHRAPGRPGCTAHRAGSSRRRRRTPEPLGEPEQPGGHPPGHVEEVELLDVIGQPAQLAGQGRQQGVAGGRLGVDQQPESLARQDQRLGRLEGDRRRRARRPVEQGQLAEEGARPDGGQDRLVALLGRQHDLDRPGGDDEQRVARVALVEEDLVAPEAAGPHPGRQPLERRRDRDPANSCTRSSASIADPPRPSLAMVHAGAVGGPTASHVGPRLPDAHGRAPILGRVTCLSRAVAALGHPVAVRLTVLGCGPAVATAGYARLRAPRRVRVDGDPARLRPGRRRAAGRPARAGPADARSSSATCTPTTSSTCRRSATASPGRGRLGRRGCRSSCRPAGWPGSPSWPASSASGTASSTMPSRSASTTRRRRTGRRAGASTFVPGRHYVPAWGVVADRARRDADRLCRRHRSEPRLVDGGRAARTCSSARRPSARPAEDDQDRRGHLTLDEAIDHGRAAEVERLLITHYPSARREAMADASGGSAARAALARPDLASTVADGRPAAARGRRRAPRPADATGHRSRPHATARPDAATARRSTGPAPRCGPPPRSSGRPRSGPARSAPTAAGPGLALGDRRDPDVGALADGHVERDRAEELDAVLAGEPLAAARGRRSRSPRRSGRTRSRPCSRRSR